MEKQNLFKWKHYQPDSILLTVRWYLRYKLSFRDSVEMMEERGLSMAHTTIMRWLHQYGPLGSRTNPVPFQKTATVDDELYDDEGNVYAIKFDLTITEVIRGDEAYQKLLSMNEFNEAAPEGYEWVLAKTKVKFIESETEDLAFHIDGIMNFKMVSESGDIYSGDVYGTTEPDFSFEMYVGSENRRKSTTSL